MVDINQPGEYPIILGDSLKDAPNSAAQLLRLRYNWTPTNSFANRRGQLTKIHDDVRLDFEHGKPQYHFSGWESNGSTSDVETSDLSHLALVFDESKSVFVLERIRTTLNLNLTSASDRSNDEAKDRTQILRPEKSERIKKSNGVLKEVKGDAEEDAADSLNPFDFRHFLSEARELTDRGGNGTGQRTPLPGGLTPLNGVSSPIPGTANRFLSDTPRFKPTSTPPKSKSTGLRKPTAAAAASNKRSQAAKTKQPTSSSTQPTTQTLSKERIEDSDEEMADAPSLPAISARSNSKGSSSITKSRKRAQKASAGGGGERNSPERSPPRSKNDDYLEIDLGSPPPEDRRRRNRFDPGAFRSNIGTPISGPNSNRSRPAGAFQSTKPSTTNNDRNRDSEREATSPNEDIDMDDDDDHQNNDKDGKDDNDDADVEELELGSPQSPPRKPSRRQRVSPSPPPVHTASQRSYSNSTPRASKQHHQHPAPMAEKVQEDEEPEQESDDEMAALEKVLEDALAQEDDDEGDDNRHVGLGIRGSANDDDESEVSEEE